MRNAQLIQFSSFFLFRFVHTIVTEFAVFFSIFFCRTDVCIESCIARNLHTIYFYMMIRERSSPLVYSSSCADSCAFFPNWSGCVAHSLRHIVNLCTDLLVKWRNVEFSAGTTANETKIQLMRCTAYLNLVEFCCKHLCVVSLFAICRVFRPPFSLDECAHDAVSLLSILFRF